MYSESAISSIGGGDNGSPPHRHTILTPPSVMRRLEPSARDRALIEALGLYQVLTIDQFQRVLGAEHRSYPAKVMAKMRDQELVEHCHVPGHGYAYRLSDDGVRLGKAIGVLDDDHLSKVSDWKGEWRLGAVHHDIVMVDTMISFMKAIEARPHLELLEIDTDIRTVLREKSSSKKTMRKKITEEELPSGKTLICDWRAAFQHVKTGETATIRVEIDCVSYKKWRVADKWRAYEQLFSSKKRWWSNSRTELVLFASTGPRRVDLVMNDDVWSECKNVSDMMRFAHISPALHSDFLGAIWQEKSGEKIPIVDGRHASGANRS